ncbi:MAG: flagellar hook-associated protein FlgL, partial [Actinoplanes sp.]
MSISSNRVTGASIHTRVMGDLQRNMAQSQKLTEQISSGKQLHRPSDSPTGTVTSLQLRGEMRATQQYSRNANDGLGWLGTIQDKLSDASTSIIRVRDLTVHALNATNTAQSGEALAVEIDNIRATLIGEANSKFMGRPVFGGTTPGTEAYDPGTGAYKGNDGQTTRTVGPNAKVRIETSGPEAFGVEGSDTQLFKVLSDLSAAIRTGDRNGIDKGLGNLDTAHDLLKATLSDVGARYNRVTQMKQSAEDHLLSVSSQLSDIEDVDLPKA